ncbi:MAG TPA: M56 family metallopeptidase [Gemmataceae bacterium]|nr:M56 family metallopeptidase [Gemmataceae bacterium]
MTDLGPVLLALAAQVTLPLVGGLILSRRRDPAAACGPLAVALVAVLMLTPLAFLPRPAWPTHEAPHPGTTEIAPETVAAPAGAAPPGGVNVLDLLRLARPANPTEAPERFNPWAVAAWVVVGLAAFGLVRLALGVLAVRRLIRASEPLDEPGERTCVSTPMPIGPPPGPLRASARLLTVFDELRVAVGVRRSVDLRESPAVASAATAGWLRPVVLVSPAWRTWSAAEVRAVLAHELAHVARGDFLTRLAGRLAVAVHGYHPFVRWAAGRLELRQEMAADARAADACGGRPAYLKCLAALALKADAAPVGPVPTFLSRPRTLLRRIAMLRVTDDAPVRSRRWPALAAVGLLAAAALGLHATRPEVLAGPVVRVKAEEEVRPDPLDVSYVFPGDDKDCVGAYAIRVNEVLKTPGLEAAAEQYAAAVPAAFGDGKKMLFELKDVEQVCGRVSVRHEPEKPSPNRALMMSLSAIRMAKDFDWIKQLREWCGELKEHTHGKGKYYSARLDLPALGFFKHFPAFFYLPDARTVVLESESNIKDLIDGKKPPKPLDWGKIDGGTAAFALTDPKTRLAKKLTPPAGPKDDPEAKVIAALADVFAKADGAVIGVDVGKTCRLKLVVTRAQTEPGVTAEQNKAIEAFTRQAGAAAAKAGWNDPAKVMFTAAMGVDSEPMPRAVSTLEVDLKGGVGELLGQK